jgi:hypothetical protein
MHVDTPAADIDQLAWLGVEQHPLIPRYGKRRRLLLGEDDVTDANQQGYKDGATTEGRVEKSWHKVTGESEARAVNRA